MTKTKCSEDVVRKESSESCRSKEKVEANVGRICVSVQGNVQKSVDIECRRYVRFARKNQVSVVLILSLSCHVL